MKNNSFSFSFFIHFSYRVVYEYFVSLSVKIRNAGLLNVYFEGLNWSCSSSKNYFAPTWVNFFFVTRCTGNKHILISFVKQTDVKRNGWTDERWFKGSKCGSNDISSITQVMVKSQKLILDHVFVNVEWSRILFQNLTRSERSYDRLQRKSRTNQLTINETEFKSQV